MLWSHLLESKNIDNSGSWDDRGSCSGSSLWHFHKGSWIAWLAISDGSGLPEQSVEDLEVIFVNANHERHSNTDDSVNDDGRHDATSADFITQLSMLLRQIKSKILAIDRLSNQQLCPDANVLDVIYP